MTMNTNILTIITIICAIITCVLGAHIINDRNQSNEATITIFSDTCTMNETGFNCDGTIQ